MSETDPATGKTIYYCALCGDWFESLQEHIFGDRSPPARRHPPDREYEPVTDEDLGLSRTTLRWEQEREEHFERYGVRN